LNEIKSLKIKEKKLKNLPIVTDNKYHN